MSSESVRKRLEAATPGPWRAHPNWADPLASFVRTVDSDDYGYDGHGHWY